MFDWNNKLKSWKYKLPFSKTQYQGRSLSRVSWITSDHTEQKVAIWCPEMATWLPRNQIFSQTARFEETHQSQGKDISSEFLWNPMTRFSKRTNLWAWKWLVQRAWMSSIKGASEQRFAEN